MNTKTDEAFFLLEVIRNQRDTDVCYFLDMFNHMSRFELVIEELYAFIVVGT